MPLELELDGIFSDEITEPVTYIPDGGEALPVFGVVDRQAYEYVTTSNGTYLVKTAKILLNAADIPEPVPSGDSIVLDSLEWFIDAYDPVGVNDAYLVHIVRRERSSKKAR